MNNFTANLLSDFSIASNREWIETNGIGGFASGTVAGANTRRYHAILTSATRPPLGRITVLSKLEETLIIGDEQFELSSNQFVDAVNPHGYQYLVEFRLDPFPVWTFEAGGLRLEKRLFMIHGSNAAVTRWQILGDQPRAAILDVKPLLSFADYHSLQRESNGLSFRCLFNENEVSVMPDQSEISLNLYFERGVAEPTGFWYRNFSYAIERERGFDHTEDLFQPFSLKLDLSTGSTHVIASTDAIENRDAVALEKSEIQRRNKLTVKSKSDFDRQLNLAADQFVVGRGNGQTIIAGYPWFSDWGRDTMIALPGLTLTTGRTDIAKNILLEFSKHISDGMLPNRFPDAGDEAEYNTVDATLWFFEAIRRYVEATGDLKFVRDKLYKKLADIIAWHLHGTRYNIHLDTDGLLYAGDPDVQLTWMDAKIGDLVITPRTGKAVEIQALWFNALCIMQTLAKEFGDLADAAKYRAMADLCKLSFNGAFWNKEDKCLFDVVENGNRDSAIRPNQIFAVSLFHSMLDAERSANVLAKVQSELLTPVGLRSLAPGDAEYRGVYIGSPFDRDSAYHQGTVWAWLIGPFIDAYRKVHGEDAETEQSVDGFLSGLRSHLLEAGVGQISEIFDGDFPHHPRGCPAQAWSVAEILRVLKPTARYG